MTLREIVNMFKITMKAGVKTPFLDISIEYNDVDRLAAWDLYVELITRVVTQELNDDTGDEATALKSIYSIFGTTRDILHKNGPRCLSFAKVAILVMNKIIRPFTSKWHKISTAEGFSWKDQRVQFRSELGAIQTELRKYTNLLSEIAGLGEDIVDVLTFD